MSGNNAATTFRMLLILNGNKKFGNKHGNNAATTATNPRNPLILKGNNLLPTLGSTYGNNPPSLEGGVVALVAQR
jgi:hypothetical protein